MVIGGHVGHLVTEMIWLLHDNSLHVCIITHSPKHMKYELTPYLSKAELFSFIYILYYFLIFFLNLTNPKVDNICHIAITYLTM